MSNNRERMYRVVLMILRVDWIYPSSPMYTNVAQQAAMIAPGRLPTNAQEGKRPNRIMPYYKNSLIKSKS